eukprot:TRINITY_DN759_c1_g1_i4.p3 TRINITY_DN759_c1_g1~~TRINITY_DN759_c1_g1_i4.p3  ORF type:complete len:107 (+),score=25.02 TRINITY_DN759_c1_g1_i4:85-405(+)
MRRVILFAILFLALAALLSTADAAEVGRGGSKQIRAAIEATEQRKRLAVRRARRRLLRPFRKKWRARMNKVRRARRSARKELKVGLDLELKKVHTGTQSSPTLVIG